MTKKQTSIPAQVSEYMRQIGRKGGQKNKEKGKKFFANISKGKTWEEIKQED